MPLSHDRVLPAYTDVRGHLGYKLSARFVYGSSKFRYVFKRNKSGLIAQDTVLIRFDLKTAQSSS